MPIDFKGLCAHDEKNAITIKRIYNESAKLIDICNIAFDTNP